MAEDVNNLPEAKLLPVRQRIAWIAAIWLLSVGAMVLVTLAVRSLIG
jgi:hypothetical protein